MSLLATEAAAHALSGQVERVLNVDLVAAFERVWGFASGVSKSVVQLVVEIFVLLE